MKPLILLVEDNADLLYNLKLTLEFNQYEVASASDGINALDLLSGLKAVPNVIVSDIMMPNMDGYNFFKEVSKNPKWSQIPFIFLTARTSSEDVRFGKMLGVDDYIVKPFKEEDLLAVVAGKITRAQKNQSINLKIGELLSNLKIDAKPSIKVEEKTMVFLLYVLWDDKHGPKLEMRYPQNVSPPYSIDSVGFQLFNGVASIYGQSYIHKAQGILLDIENIKMQGYIFFNAIEDRAARGHEKPFMVGVIAPQINYLDSLRIKQIFSELTVKIKSKEPWEIKPYWERISEILVTPLV